MSTPAAELEQFQAALLELLAQDLTLDEITHHLKTDAAFAPFQNYVNTFEPRFVEVASSLVKKWGKRDAGSREAGTAVGYTSMRDFSENS